MTAGGEPDAGDLARYPDLAEVLVEQGANARIQLGNGVQTARGFQVKQDLLHASFAMVTARPISSCLPSQPKGRHHQVAEA